MASVGKATATPSGNLIFMQHAELSTTITHLPTGEVEIRSSKSNSGVMYKNGVYFSTHGVSRESTTIAGVTCDVKYAVVVSQGVLRHFIYDVACS